MEHLNLVELLRDCPTGMELDCTVFDNITFDYVNTQQNRVYCKVGKSESVWFTPKGGVNLLPDAKCVIYPKGKTTWEGFQRPFEDGDIVFSGTDLISIFKEQIAGIAGRLHSYVSLRNSSKLEVDKDCWSLENIRFATEEEKQKLFDAIKAYGYKWNTETKTLEKLITPKFKVGNKIKHKVNKTSPFTITEITDTSYKGGYRYEVLIEQQDNFELVPNKFDIATLKPFDKVLVRNTNTEYWRISLFGVIVHDDRQYFMCLANSGFYQCVPYEKNEHLLGTTNDCDPFFKTW